MKRKWLVVVALAAVAGCGAEPQSAETQAPAAAPTSSHVTGVVPPHALVTLLPDSGEPPMPTGPALMDQISKQFIPNVLVARVGQPVEFHNSDDLPHNVTVLRRGSGAEVFNVSTEREQKYVHTFDRVGQYDVRCDIHEGMEALVIVARGPQTTVAGDDGSFSFAGVPFGAYRLSVTYTGQTVEQRLDVKGPRTEVRISP